MRLFKRCLFIETGFANTRFLNSFGGYFSKRASFFAVGDFYLFVCPYDRGYFGRLIFPRKITCTINNNEWFILFVTHITNSVAWGSKRMKNSLVSRKGRAFVFA